MYNGPNPKDININWPNHSYEYITCLVSGQSKKSILNKHLRDFGHNRESYKKAFPGAPLMSEKSRDNYKKSARSDKGKKVRSENLKNLNLNSEEFQEKRTKAFNNFLKSNRSLEYRQKASEKAKKQHAETDLNQRVSSYFENSFRGSLDQKNRSKRMKGNNNISKIPSVKEKAKQTYIENSKKGIHSFETQYKKKKYKETNLIYQSSYELDFLNMCEENNLLHRITNCHCFTSEEYPYNYYEPDYCLDNQTIIEIKSWYIENLQEKKCPGLLTLKKNLIESEGYNFMYIRDKNYDNFLEFIKNEAP